MSINTTNLESHFDFSQAISYPPSCKGSILITGSSTGIGKASALHLAQAGYCIFAGVRTAQHAIQLKASAVDAQCEAYIHPIQLDICDAEHIQQCVQKITETLYENQTKYLTALVNNAGIALGGPLLELPLETLRTQFEVNVVGQLAMIQAFAHLLGPVQPREPSTVPTTTTESPHTTDSLSTTQQKPGKIIQISSISGIRSMPFLGPYSASKFALEGLSDALRMELLPYGIDVIIIQPGPIQTAIWDKAPTPDNSPYQNSPYLKALTKFYTFFVEDGKKGLPAIEIAKIVKKSIENPKASARYVKTPGRLMRYWLPKILPTRTFDRKIGDLLGLSPEKFHR